MELTDEKAAGLTKVRPFENEATLLANLLTSGNASRPEIFDCRPSPDLGRPAHSSNRDAFTDALPRDRLASVDCQPRVQFRHHPKSRRPIVRFHGREYRQSHAL